jgi:hypothetical protein
VASSSTGAVTADEAQAVVLDPAGGGDVDAHPGELTYGPGREAVAAHLLAGERGLLQQQDVEAGLGEVVGGRGARRAGTDDDDVGLPLVGGGPRHDGAHPSCC